MNNIAKLGFGMMRLPLAGSAIDFDTAYKMVDLFFESGGAWIDTAWGYHNGESEPFVGRAIARRHPRQRFLLATKLPVWLVEKPEDAQRIFQTQLERTGVQWFDRYLLHALNQERLERLEVNGLWDFARSLKAQGLIKSYGFSFHDTADVLESILSDQPDVDFVQLQINYLDWEDPLIQSRKCYEVARAHKKPVVIMEPVKGGMLAALPEEAAAPLRALHPDWSDARWALNFCLDLEGVDLVLSGMSAMGQMTENLDTFAAFSPLGEAERAALREAARRLEAMPSIACTACGYCVEGCPQHINIPGIFDIATSAMRFGAQPVLVNRYEELIKNGSGRAGDCIACGACEESCPQRLEIIRLLGESAALLDHT
jgi:predicted aldo/keto reductase-like oxidoreductase